MKADDDNAVVVEKPSNKINYPGDQATEEDGDDDAGSLPSGPTTPRENKNLGGAGDS